jgi:hypothetical protein
MHHKSCAFIYSSKELLSDAPLIDMFGLNRERSSGRARLRTSSSSYAGEIYGIRTRPATIRSIFMTGIRPKLWRPISPNTGSAQLNSFLLKKQACST